MKKEIKEVVGVPAGILKSAEQLYTNLVNAFEDTNDMEFVFRGTYKEEFSFPTKFKINELDITSVDVLVNYNVVENDKLEIAGAGYMGELGVNYRRFMVIFMNEPNEVNLSMDFLIPNDREIVFEELVEYVYENKSIIVSSLAHELKHAYDSFKRPNRKITTQADYQANTKADGYGIGAFRKFYMMLYLATTIEQLVKPTEVASRMNIGNINQKDFLEFLLKDRTYEDFNDLRNYSMDELISDLLKQEKKLRSFDQFKNLSQEEFINQLLKVGYISLTQEKIDSIEEFVLRDNDRLLNMMGVDTPNMEYFIKQVNNYKKYANNPKDFFTKEIKFLNIVGDKMIKKLGKLYSIANEDDSEQANIIKKIYNKVNHGQGQ
jgi:hypothetical protein